MSPSPEKSPGNGGQGTLPSKKRAVSDVFERPLAARHFATCANVGKRAIRTRRGRQKLALTAIFGPVFDRDDLIEL